LIDTDLKSASENFKKFHVRVVDFLKQGATEENVSTFIEKFGLTDVVDKKTVNAKDIVSTAIKQQENVNETIANIKEFIPPATISNVSFSDELFKGFYDYFSTTLARSTYKSQEQVEDLVLQEAQTWESYHKILTTYCTTKESKETLLETISITFSQDNLHINWIARVFQYLLNYKIISNTEQLEWKKKATSESAKKAITKLEIYFTSLENHK